MIKIDKMEYEDVDDYISYNEQINDDEIECPYCHQMQKDLDPYIQYRENEDEVLMCEYCEREFLLNSTYHFTHTTTPVKEEVEKMIEVEDE